MILLENDIRNAGVDAMMLELDEGVGEPSMEIQESDDTVLLTIGLNATRAVAAASAGVGTFNNPTTGGGNWSTFSQNPSASGTAAKAILKDGDGTARAQMTVSTIAAGTGEVQFTTLAFDTGVPVTTDTAPTITMPTGS